jgi:hypothetical protein
MIMAISAICVWIGLLIHGKYEHKKVEEISEVIKVVIILLFFGGIFGTLIGFGYILGARV